MYFFQNWIKKSFPQDVHKVIHIFRKNTPKQGFFDVQNQLRTDCPHSYAHMCTERNLKIIFYEAD